MITPRSWRNRNVRQYTYAAAAPANKRNAVIGAHGRSLFIYCLTDGRGSPAEIGNVTSKEHQSCASNYKDVTQRVATMNRRLTRAEVTLDLAKEGRLLPPQDR